MTQSGTVKWFNDDKGYGFVVLDEGGDAFVHLSTVENQSLLKEGEAVIFETIPGIRGTNAINVRGIEQL